MSPLRGSADGTRTEDELATDLDFKDLRELMDPPREAGSNVVKEEAKPAQPENHRPSLPTLPADPKIYSGVVKGKLARTLTPPRFSIAPDAKAESGRTGLRFPTSPPGNGSSPSSPSSPSLSSPPSFNREPFKEAPSAKPGPKSSESGEREATDRNWGDLCDNFYKQDAYSILRKLPVRSPDSELFEGLRTIFFSKLKLVYLRKDLSAEEAKLKSSGLSRESRESIKSSFEEIWHEVEVIVEKTSPANKGYMMELAGIAFEGIYEYSKELEVPFIKPDFYDREHYLAKHTVNLATAALRSNPGNEEVELALDTLDFTLDQRLNEKSLEKKLDGLSNRNKRQEINKRLIVIDSQLDNIFKQLVDSNPQLLKTIDKIKKIVRHTIENYSAYFNKKYAENSVHPPAAPEEALTEHNAPTLPPPPNVGVDELIGAVIDGPGSANTNRYPAPYPGIPTPGIHGIYSSNSPTTLEGNPPPPPAGRKRVITRRGLGSLSSQPQNPQKPQNQLSQPYRPPQDTVPPPDDVRSPLITLPSAQTPGATAFSEPAEPVKPTEPTAGLAPAEPAAASVTVNPATFVMADPFPRSSAPIDFMNDPFPATEIRRTAQTAAATETPAKPFLVPPPVSVNAETRRPASSPGRISRFVQAAAAAALMATATMGAFFGGKRGIDQTIQPPQISYAAPDPALRVATQAAPKLAQPVSKSTATPQASLPAQAQPQPQASVHAPAAAASPKTSPTFDIKPGMGLTRQIFEQYIRQNRLNIEKINKAHALKARLEKAASRYEISLAAGLNKNQKINELQNLSAGEKRTALLRNLEGFIPESKKLSNADMQEPDMQLFINFKRLAEEKGITNVLAVEAAANGVSISDLGLDELGN